MRVKQVLSIDREFQPQCSTLRPTRTSPVFEVVEIKDSEDLLKNVDRSLAASQSLQIPRELEAVLQQADVHREGRRADRLNLVDDHRQAVSLGCLSERFFDSLDNVGREYLFCAYVVFPHAQIQGFPSPQLSNRRHAGG